MAFSRLSWIVTSHNLPSIVMINSIKHIFCSGVTEAHCLHIKSQITTIPRSPQELGSNQWLAANGVTALALVHLCASFYSSCRGLAVNSVREEHSIHGLLKVGVTDSIFITLQKVYRNCSFSL